MTNDRKVVNWQGILDKYLIIKKLYIECEETDPALLTNLQPLNEFKHSLDHCMRLIAQEKGLSGEGLNSNSEESMLVGHLRRAFFDVCDHLSINYRNKIIEALKSYDHDTISKVLPEYYTTTRSRIDAINSDIAELRMSKGQNMEADDALFDTYANIILELKNIYKNISDHSSAFEDIHKSKEHLHKEQFKKPFIISTIIGVLSIIAAVLVGVL